jgi:hypothetical protein
MKMNGVEHDMLMPGMLTDEKWLPWIARRPEFDRLFLVGMITSPGRHRRAVQGVRRGAGRDGLPLRVRRLRRPVHRDRRMNKMLEEGP